jgi:hypothetical protein
MSSNSDLNKTKKLMGALVHQPPKLHDEMKLGKASAKQPKSPASKQPRAASAKPKSA